MKRATLPALMNVLRGSGRTSGLASGATEFGRWPLLPGKAVASSVIAPMLFMW